MLKKITLTITFTIILLATACGKQDTTLNSANISDFMAINPQIIVSIKSYQIFIKDFFSISTYFFEKDAIRELKNKLFSPLKDQLGLDLLNKEKLEQAGFNIHANCLLAIYPQQRFYISLPLNSTKKVMKFIGTFNDANLEFQNKDNIQTAENRQFRFLISSKRLFIIDKKIKPSKKTSPYLVKMVRRLNRESKNRVIAIHTGSSSFTPLLPLNSNFSLNTQRNSLQIKANWLKRRNPLYSIFNSIFNKSLALKIEPYLTASKMNKKILKMTTPITPFFLNLNIKQNKLWKKEIKPRIIKKAEKKIGAVGSFVVNLFSPNKPMVEKIIDGLEIDLQILHRMTGNIGLVINDISQLQIISPSTRNMLNNIAGFFYLEFKSKALAKAAWLHARSLLNSYKIKVTEDEYEGEPHYSISLYRFRIPSYLFFKQIDNFIFISHNHESITKIRANFFQKKENSQLAFLKNKRHNYISGINITTIYKMLTKQLDSITQGNLAPLSQQIKKIKSILLYNQPYKTRETIGLKINLKRRLRRVDPFEDKTELFDTVFLLLTIFFVMLIIFFIFRTLLIKIKMRKF